MLYNMISQVFIQFENWISLHPVCCMALPSINGCMILSPLIFIDNRNRLEDVCLGAGWEQPHRRNTLRKVRATNFAWSWSVGRLRQWGWKIIWIQDPRTFNARRRRMEDTGGFQGWFCDQIWDPGELERDETWPVSRRGMLLTVSVED